jgi:hypothetical protein
LVNGDFEKRRRVGSVGRAEAGIDDRVFVEEGGGGHDAVEAVGVVWVDGSYPVFADVDDELAGRLVAIEPGVDERRPAQPARPGSQ